MSSLDDRTMVNAYGLRLDAPKETAHPPTFVLDRKGSVVSASGAIMSHLTVLGIAVQGDGGLLFGLALIAFSSSLVTLILHHRQIPLHCQLFQLTGSSETFSSL